MNNFHVLLVSVSLAVATLFWWAKFSEKRKDSESGGLVFGAGALIICATAIEVEFVFSLFPSLEERGMVIVAACLMANSMLTFFSGYGLSKVNWRKRNSPEAPSNKGDL